MSSHGGDRRLDEKKYPRILTAGDGCVVAEFGDSIDPAVNSRVAAMGGDVWKLAFPGVLDVVPTYRSLAVYFDPVNTDVKRLYA
ncbi:MAG: carboxyltransferase domain-containing protein, partial [Synergistales bacterium]|nr:carboxyltransferase domain-containing protein [Synergistales bacterium]